ncbi:SH3 domain-containing protein [Streptomyces sp. NPDC088194]|uniref:SH3 domain-containing protein n=1 Tax=Streptomyces sp. NPDC088194 TaxID=3154931 RepID=UPI00344F7C74
MYSAHAKHRVTAGIAGLLIAGSGLLAATSAYAADPKPGTGTDTGTAAAPAAPAQDAQDAQGAQGAQGSTPAAGTSAAAPTSDGQQAQAAAEPQGKVISRLPLTIREMATSNSRSLGSFQPGTVIWLHCKVVGQNVEGNKLWYKLGNGRAGYVSARYVQNLAVVPYCK